MTQPTTIARAGAAPAGELAAFVPPHRGRLNPYAPDGIDRSAARILPLAIVSLGAKVGNENGAMGRPRATQKSDKQWFHLHQPYGPTPGIEAALKKGEWKRLTIMLPDDNRDTFLTQMWTRYTATSLEAWGDARGLHVIYKTNTATGAALPKPRHIYLEADSPDPKVREEYKRQFASCTPETRLFFELAEWGLREGQPFAYPVYPDGMGYYALRTGSTNSVKIVDGNLDTIQRATNGRLKGIPLEMEVIFVPATGPDGMRREVPCVRLLLKPPFEGGFTGQPMDMRRVLDGSIEQARMLEMPALPAAPEPEDLILEGEVAVGERKALEDAASGDFLCNYHEVLRAFMAATAGYSDDQRHAWLAAWSAEALGSERAFSSRRGLASLSHLEAVRMLADLNEGLRALPPHATSEVVTPDSPDASAAAAALPAGGQQAEAGEGEDPADADPAEDEESVDEESAEADPLAQAHAALSTPAPVSPPMLQQQVVESVSRFPGNPEESVTLRSREGAALASAVQRARALKLNVTAFQVTYPEKRSEVVRRIESLEAIIAATAGESAGPPSTASQDKDSPDLESLPF